MLGSCSAVPGGFDAWRVVYNTQKFVASDTDALVRGLETFRQSLEEAGGTDTAGTGGSSAGTSGASGGGSGGSAGTDAAAGAPP